MTELQVSDVGRWWVLIAAGVVAAVTLVSYLIGATLVAVWQWLERRAERRRALKRLSVPLWDGSTREGVNPRPLGVRESQRKRDGNGPRAA